MRVVLTGGGTLGHVTPNLAVIEEFTERSRKHSLLYIGQKNGPERNSVVRFIESKNLRNLKYEGISAGKLRRYFSFENFLDFFKFLTGCFQSFFILRKFDPHVIFSKGGFVSLPVVLAGGFINFFRKFGGTPIIIFVHESDVVPGLANKIASKFANKVLLSFEKTRGIGENPEVVGNPVRAFLFKGDRSKGLKMCGFNKFRPVLLVMGGSQGSLQVNNLVWDNLDELLKKWQVVHITGKGNIKFGLKVSGYKQFELLFDELKDIYAACDLVVSRGGANSLSEIAALGKKALVIPLGIDGSRGDQIVNARICAEEYGFGVLYDHVTNEKFLRGIDAIELGESSAGTIHKKSSKRIVDLILESVLMS